MPSYACEHCKDAVSSVFERDAIIVHGAREHNLKNVCFRIPKGQLIALTGPSGSGKTSLAVDILQKECVRQLLESLGMTTDHLEKVNADCVMGLSPSIGVSQRLSDSNVRSTVGTKTGLLTILRNLFAVLGCQPCSSCGNDVKQPLRGKHHVTTMEVESAGSSTKTIKKQYFDCPYCGDSLEKLEMGHFSCNTVLGMCGECKGSGELFTLDLARLLCEEKSLREGGVVPWGAAMASYYEGVLCAASRHYNFPFDPALPLQKYSLEQREFLLHGVSSPSFLHKYKSVVAPKKVSEGKFEGVIPPLLGLYKKDPNVAEAKRYFKKELCCACGGERLGQLGRTVRVAGKTISTLSVMGLDELGGWIRGLEMLTSGDEKRVLMAFSEALKERIGHIIEVGLGHLSLDRPLSTLSGGEAQRLRLASLLGSALTGVLYVFDEPTTGLHPNDTKKLVATLKKLQSLGNTVIVVEHDADVIKASDYVIDMGPSGGSGGGYVVAQGSPRDISACKASITGRYLFRRFALRLDQSFCRGEVIAVRGASAHNLKSVDVDIPTRQLVVLTGVSGSGKSTFLCDVVDNIARNESSYFRSVVTVDQKPVGRTGTARSNVATYSKVFDSVRDLFAAQSAAKAQGLGPEKFSFNTSDERCRNCNGAGVVEIDMAFMPDVEAQCPACGGARFNQAVLSIRLHARSIADVLEMTVDEARAFFSREESLRMRLDVMVQVGLGHLKLGQPMSTLSGGEAQRLKLAAELGKSKTGRTLYLLDEPTTGLHPCEVEWMLKLLRGLVGRGATVLVVEHNLDVMCEADTIIDFGPGGGQAGGNIVAMGTPREIIEHADSLTGQCMRAYVEAAVSS